MGAWAKTMSIGQSMILKKSAINRKNCTQIPDVLPSENNRSLSEFIPCKLTQKWIQSQKELRKEIERRDQEADEAF